MRGHVVSAKRRGIPQAQIDALDAPERWPEVFSREEIAALDFATRLCFDATNLGADLIEELKQVFSQRQIAELILLASAANMYNRGGLAAKQIWPEHWPAH